MNSIFHKIQTHVLRTLGALIIGAIAFTIWEWMTDGSLIKYLGGAVIENMQCVAHPAEDFQSYRPCMKDEFTFAEWCSGDCNSDDARVTICCKK